MPGPLGRQASAKSRPLQGPPSARGGGSLICDGVKQQRPSSLELPDLT